MKLFPLLLLALASNAMLQESDTQATPKPVQDPAEQTTAVAQEPVTEPAPLEVTTPPAEPKDVQDIDPGTFASDPLVVDDEPPQAGSAPTPPAPILATPLLDPAESGSFAIGEPLPQAEVELRGSSHAPIGVPLTQQVATGEFGLVLRAVRNQYDGMRDGRDDLSSAQIFGLGYTVAPTKRTDDWVELEAYYGLNERWDLYLVLPYAGHELDYDQSLGGTGNVETTGLGDLQLGGIFRSYDVDGTRVSYLAGVSIPTGSIDQRDTYAGVGNAKLPYDLQLGSGTLDLLPGVLIESRWNRVLVGARASGRIHLQSENDEDWFRSNSMRLDVWAGARLLGDLTGTVRVQGDWWGDFHGADPDLDPARNPGEDALRQGGDRVNVYGGLSYEWSEKHTNRLELEVGAPVEEWLDGPQLSQELSLLVGWRVNF
ncbi:MAG: transporter [Planctomycetes bacterium]|nr:transporter [Planctomycetota bacterium]MCB9908854.1 transporter [Planctomycetota bacterium]